MRRQGICLRASKSDPQYHPGYFGKVGMRHYHLLKNHYFRPTINIDKLISLPEAQVEAPEGAVPVIDLTHLGKFKLVSCFYCIGGGGIAWGEGYRSMAELVLTLSSARAVLTSPSSSRPVSCRGRRSRRSRRQEVWSSSSLRWVW